MVFRELKNWICILKIHNRARNSPGIG